MANDIDILNSTFEIYLEKAKDSHRENRVNEAKKYYYLAAQELLKIAKQSSGSLQKAQLARAKNLIELADKIAVPKKQTTNETEQGESSALPTHEAEEMTLEEAMARLDSMIGLGGVKSQISDWIDQIKIFNLRREKGLATPEMTYHLVFLGNPGTGKTTVARLIGQIYRSLGVLKRGHVIEADRSRLVGEYIGKTAPLTRKAIEAAQDGILFIDEAYSLIKPGDSGNDFGQEAVDTLLMGLENNRSSFVCICAGYRDKMEPFIESNPGLRSRFKNFIQFDDYTPDELYEIFLLQCKNAQFVLTPEATAKLKRYMTVSHDAFRSNGRDVRNLFERVITEQSKRLARITTSDKDLLMTIEAADLDFLSIPSGDVPVAVKVDVPQEKPHAEEPIRPLPDEVLPEKSRTEEPDRPSQDDADQTLSPEDEVLSRKGTTDDEYKFEWDELPSVSFADIAGLDEVKETVMNKVILPLKNPQAFEGYVSKGGGGLFLYGPPGTGKTMIAAAIAKEVGASFCSIKPSDLLRQGVGNSERAVRSLFTQAREHPCAVIYFDEMDSLCPKSTRSQYARQLRSELLSQLQGIDSYKKGNGNLLFLIAATNKPWDVDSAFIRPGRFGTKVYVGLPDAGAREYLIGKRIGKLKSGGIVEVREDIDVDAIVEATNGFNGADLSNLLDTLEETSILRSIRTGEKYICGEDFDTCLKKIHSSVQADDLVNLAEWKERNDS